MGGGGISADKDGNFKEFNGYVPVNRNFFSVHNTAEQRKKARTDLNIPRRHNVFDFISLRLYDKSEKSFQSIGQNVLSAD